MYDEEKGLLGAFDLQIEEPQSQEEEWFCQVMEQFLLARAYADAMAWLKDARGPNAAIMLGQARRLHMASLSQLRYLGQRAFMLWGVNIPMPKGLKE